MPPRLRPPPESGIIGSGFRVRGAARSARHTVNVEVAGSNPVVPAKFRWVGLARPKTLPCHGSNTGSNPVLTAKFGVLMPAADSYLDTVEAAGSTPVGRTKFPAGQIPLGQHLGP